uniref:RING-type domain-containing protein n=1 Tax=Leersia perrieri TaxID=77586 RepID=A0A0D9WL85_9ORYZ
MATVGHPDAMRRITVHYVNPPFTGTGEVHADGLDDEVLGYVIGDVLQDQEGLYQSILYTYGNDMRGARNTAQSDGSHYYHGENSSGEATTSRVSEIDEQIEYDLVLARQLQGMENLTIETPADEDDDISCVPSPSDSETDEPAEGNNEEEDATQDDNDDPDNMTYEQRQALVESVGNEDRGLSDLLISYLETWKYKSGFFPRKANHDDCPICLSTFTRRETLITLACKHSYHAGCAARWLKIDRSNS